MSVWFYTRINCDDNREGVHLETRTELTSKAQIRTECRTLFFSPPSRFNLHYQFLLLHLILFCLQSFPPDPNLSQRRRRQGGKKKLLFEEKNKSFCNHWVSCQKEITIKKAINLSFDIVLELEKTRIFLLQLTFLSFNFPRPNQFKRRGQLISISNILFAGGTKCPRHGSSPGLRVQW